jgi:hypothetical protein
MRIHPGFPQTPHTATTPSRTNLLKRLGLMSCGFVCAGWLSAAMVSAYTDTSHISILDERSQGEGLALIAQGGCQELVTDGPLRINIEAYNRKRERDITQASQKLLSLAVSLKAELDKDPGAELSRDAIEKAKAIEKLAHEVKDSMTINLVGP